MALQDACVLQVEIIVLIDERFARIFHFSLCHTERKITEEKAKGYILIKKISVRLCIS